MVEVDGHRLPRQLTALDIWVQDAFMRELDQQELVGTISSVEISDEITAAVAARVQDMLDRDVGEVATDPNAARSFDPNTGGGWFPWDLDDPGPMQSFHAFDGYQLPWDLSRRPWEHKPEQEVRVRRLRWAVERPAGVGRMELDKCGFLDPVARLRAIAAGTSIHTGMALAVSRFRRIADPSTLTDDPLDLLGRVGEPGTPDDIYADAVEQAVTWLRNQGVDALGAVTECSELLQTRDPL